MIACAHFLFEAYPNPENVDDDEGAGADRCEGMEYGLLVMEPVGDNRSEK